MGARDTDADPIARTPSDVLRLVVAAAAFAAMLVLELLFGATLAGFAHDVLTGLSAFGEPFATAVGVLVRVLGIGGLALGLALAVHRGGRRLVATVVVGAAWGAGLFALVEPVVDEHGAALVALSDVAGPLTATSFPTPMGVAAIAGAVTAAAPWLPRRRRRLGWVLTLALAGVAFAASPTSARPLVAVIGGWVGGALAIVVLGAPVARPRPAAVLAGLGAVGVDAVRLDPLAVDARGSTPYLAEAADRTRLFVKVLGHDERSADVLFRLYRAALPGDRGDTAPFGNLRRAVEHEALASLTARNLGVRTPRFVALAEAEPGGVVLAYEAVAGRSLDGVADEELDDRVVAEVWAQLAVLRAHRLAHRDLRLANVFLDDRADVWLIDFGFAELAASDLLLATDVAELTASLALKVGAIRSVAAAADAVGPPAVVAALPRLRPRYLSGATRRALALRPELARQIRTAATTRAG